VTHLVSLIRTVTVGTGITPVQPLGSWTYALQLPPVRNRTPPWNRLHKNYNTFYRSSQYP